LVIQQNTLYQIISPTKINYTYTSLRLKYDYLGRRKVRLVAENNFTPYLFKLPTPTDYFNTSYTHLNESMIANFWHNYNLSKSEVCPTISKIKN